MIGLGDKVRDRITGVTGIVVARTQWINGCIRICVQPQEVKDGKPVDTSVFDIEELVRVEAGVITPKTPTTPTTPTTNGPMPAIEGSR